MVIHLEEIGRNVYLVKEKVSLEIATLNQEHIVQLLRVQRHDWLNHIQVLNGLLKLESYEELERYIHKITLQIQQEQYIVQLGNSELILCLFTYPTRHPTVQFDVEMDEVVHLHQYSIVPEQIALLIELLELIADHIICKEDIFPSLLLRMGKLDRKVQFIVDYVGFIEEEQLSVKWEAISNRWKVLGTSIIEREKNDHEWLLEIIMG